MIALYLATALTLGPVGTSPAAGCAAGVYVVAKDDVLIALSQAKADHRKVTGMGGAILLGPLGGNRLKVKTVLAGVAATTRVTGTRPAFQFCFPVRAADARPSSDYIGVTAAVSPRDYQLVRFDQANDQRELTLSSAGGFGGPKGQISKSAIPFRAEEVAPGRYRVTLSRDLPPGQYGFLYAVSAPVSARKKDVQEQVYDFAVID